jgi:transmembrane 9 superfamily protein 2/4
VLIGEVAIVQNYVNLCYGRPNWWWRTYLLGGSVSFWIFIILAFHLLADLKVQHVTTLVVYLMVQLVVCVSGGLMAASVATVAVFIFNQQLYSKTHAD